MTQRSGGRLSGSRANGKVSRQKAIGKGRILPGPGKEACSVDGTPVWYRMEAVIEGRTSSMLNQEAVEYVQTGNTAA